MPAEYARPPGLKLPVVDEHGQPLRVAVIDRPLAPIKFAPGSEATLKSTAFWAGLTYEAKPLIASGNGSEAIPIGLGTRLRIIGVKNDGQDRICEVLDGDAAGRRVLVIADDLLPA